MSDRSTTLQEVINRAVENGRRSIRICLPAKVVKWEASTQRADCQILIKHVTPEDEEGNRVAESWPVVTGVPVQFFGAGGYRMTCPISDGGGGSAATTGSLFFSHLSLDKWLTGTGAEVDPEFDHDHALNDAIFFPGLMPFGAPWQSMPTDNMSIGSDSSGNGRIHFKSSEVQLGDGATKEVARKGDGVGAGTLVFTFVPGAGGASLAITYNPGDGGAPQVLAAGTGTITVGEKITGGSSHIKAVD